MIGIENIFVKYIKLREKLDNGKIYKITDNTNDNIYIGSTCKTLEERLSRHKYDYKSFLKGLYNNTRSFDIIKNNDYKIDLLENCQIKTKQELLARERYYIENNNCLNQVIPGRSKKEIIDYQKDYYNENKEKLKASSKNNREANKDKLNEKFDCECGGKYIYTHKSTHIKTAKHQKKLQSLK